MLKCYTVLITPYWCRHTGQIYLDSVQAMSVFLKKTIHNIINNDTHDLMKVKCTTVHVDTKTTTQFTS